MNPIGIRRLHGAHEATAHVGDVDEAPTGLAALRRLNHGEGAEGQSP